MLIGWDFVDRVSIAPEIQLSVRSNGDGLSIWRLSCSYSWFVVAIFEIIRLKSCWACLRISISHNERIKWGIRLVVGHSSLVLTNDAIIGRGIYLFLLTRAWASTCARAFTTTWLWLLYWWRGSWRSQAICWFEQAANRTKLDNPVTNAKISNPKFLFSNSYSVVPELTSALYAGAV